MNNQANINALRNFINSRPGFDSANYDGHANGYRRDACTARTQKKHALELLNLAERIGVEFHDTTPDNCMPYYGRVKFVDGQLDYTVAGYRPTEYRAQAARFIATQIWRHLYALGRYPANDSAVATLSRGARAYIV